MQRPNLENFLHPATKDKRKAYAWKPFAAAQGEYIHFLEGVISGKQLKLPKEQLPIACKKCEDYTRSLKLLRDSISTIESSAASNVKYINGILNK